MDLSILITVLVGTFTIGGTCAVTLYRLRAVERIVKKAHLRIDRLTGSDWISTGRYKWRRDAELEE